MEEETYTIGRVAFRWLGNVLDGKFPSSVAFVRLDSALIIHELLGLRNSEWMVKSYDVKSFYFRFLAILDFNTGKPQQLMLGN